MIQTRRLMHYVKERKKCFPFYNHAKFVFRLVTTHLSPYDTYIGLADFICYCAIPDSPCSFCVEYGRT